MAAALPRRRHRPRRGGAGSCPVRQTSAADTPAWPAGGALGTPGPDLRIPAGRAGLSASGGAAHELVCVGGGAASPGG